jgi:hypothetical protein
MKLNAEERRKTMAAIDQQLKQALQKHTIVEAEITHAKTLTLIHKASLA